ncbi:MAG: ABC transporter permease subunit [Holophagaceae bacterium]|nr:ABC transporter permease subunit [Holophagaceae bacterium]
MAALISVGGLTIIAAVLGMMVFIAKEAMPLFRPPSSASLGAFKLPPSQGLLVDESGKAAVLVSPQDGLQIHRLPDGQLLSTLADGPARPWRSHTPLQPRGEMLVQGQDGKLAVGSLKWSKTPGENNPANWVLEPNWEGAIPVQGEIRQLQSFRIAESAGMSGGRTLRLVGSASSGLVWLESALDETKPVALKPVPLPPGLNATCAIWNLDASALYVGTQEGAVLDFKMEGEPELLTSSEFGEPVSALGFTIGGTSLLVGGTNGKLVAYQQVRVNEVFQLQPFHAFPSLSGAVLGFSHGLRDKRFLAWTSSQVVVDHLTTERRLFSAAVDHAAQAAIAPRGDLVLAGSSDGLVRSWSLAAPHADVSQKSLWGKVHYEGYEKPDFVWQSTGGTDDFEPKFGMMPLIFGTLKGTLYAMLFALPLAIFAALYTSQFASLNLRNTIKPAVEIMAALPSVVLGFLAGLVLAPLFEKVAVELLLFPLTTLLCVGLLLPFWSRLPHRWRTIWGDGREVIWVAPVLILGLFVAYQAGPWFERAFLGGSYRGWLQSAHGITFDQRNSLVVGFAMGFAVIPIIFTISEDALNSVPKSLTSASLACGASPWQTAWRVVLPTASPGIFSAVMVGLGRAIGETMIVLMATGNTPVMDWSPFNGMRTLAANIAVEIPEAPLHGSLYRVLFLAALLLFAFTFVLNTIAELVRQRLRKRFESL